MPAIQIVVNGETRAEPAPLTVRALLDRLSVDPRLVAVERNRVVVKRAAYEATPVQQGDEIEIVAFVGGG